MIFTFSSEFWKQSNRTLYEQKTGEQTEELEGLLDTLHPSARVYFVYIY
jgi:hypothetical protein